MSKSNKEKRRLLNIRNYKNGKEELSTDSIKIKLRISFVDDNFINFYLNGNNNYSLNLGKDNKHFKKRIKRFYRKHSNELIEFKKSLKPILTKSLQKNLIEISKKVNNYNWEINAVVNLNHFLNPDFYSFDVGTIKITLRIQNPHFEGFVVFSDSENTSLNFDYLNTEIIASPNEITGEINELNKKNVYLLLEPYSYPYYKKSFFFKTIEKIKSFKKALSNNYHIEFEKRVQLSILIGDDNYYRFVRKHNKNEVDFKTVDFNSNFDILKTFISQNYFGDKAQYDEIIDSDDFESVANFVSLLDY